MAGKKTKKQPRPTAIVPRAVFAAAVALGSVPAVAGCGDDDARMFSVADGGPDAGRRDAGSFSVADGGAGFDATFSVAADTGTFSVAAPLDSGTFSVAALPDSGTFSVAAPPPDGSA